MLPPYANNAAPHERRDSTAGADGHHWRGVGEPRRSAFAFIQFGIFYPASFTAIPTLPDLTNAIGRRRGGEVKDGG